MTAFFRKLRWLTERRHKEAELREELQFHLDEEAEERQGAGLTEEDARWAARRELGNLTLIQEDTRATWGWTILEQLGQDLRYACRTMAANRVFSLLAVSSLALGIGANTAIYSFMDAILLRSLPVPTPESLVVLNWHAQTGRDSVMKAMSGTTYDDPQSGVTAGIFPFPVFELLRKNDDVFSTVFAHCQYRDVRSLNVTIGGRADLAVGWNVSGDYFRGLAVAAAAGRLIMADDDRAGAPPVVVVSHGFGQRYFGDAANAVGRAIRLNGLPFTVVGVTPPEFFGVDPAAAPDIYLPMHVIEVLGAGQQYGFRPEDWLARNYYWIQIMGRLRPGVTLAQAQAALAPTFRHWVADTATNDGERANLPELIVKEGAGGLDSLRRQYSQPLWLLMALVGLILILACANVANLLLARAAGRRREMALRLSIGAGRFRIVRQLLTESVLLASLGGALGVVFAIWGMRFLTLLLANGRANFTLHADLNWHVLGVAAALSVLTGVVFGLAPALNATRVDLVPALKEIGPPNRPRDRRSGGSASAACWWWRRWPSRSCCCSRLASLCGRSRICMPWSSASIARTCCCSRWTPERPVQGPGGGRVLHRPPHAVQRDSGGAPRESRGGLAHRRRKWTANQCPRRAAESGHPPPHGRTGVLHHDADSHPGRPRLRRARPERFAGGGRDQRGVCEAHVRRSESARPAPEAVGAGGTTACRT